MTWIKLLAIGWTMRWLSRADAPLAFVLVTANKTKAPESESVADVADVRQVDRARLLDSDHNDDDDDDDMSHQFPPSPPSKPREVNADSPLSVSSSSRTSSSSASIVEPLAAEPPPSLISDHDLSVNQSDSPQAQARKPVSKPPAFVSRLVKRAHNATASAQLPESSSSSAAAADSSNNLNHDDSASVSSSKVSSAPQ